MPVVLIIILVFIGLSQCGKTDTKDDPLGLFTDKPNQEQLLNRRLYDQDVAQDRLESCLKYMRHQSGGNEKDCPK